MNQNPILEYDRLPEDILTARKRCLWIIIFLGVLMVAFVAGSLYGITETGTRWKVILYGGEPVAAEKMSREDAIRNGFIYELSGSQTKDNKDGKE